MRNYVLSKARNQIKPLIYICLFVGVLMVAITLYYTAKKHISYTKANHSAQQGRELGREIKKYEKETGRLPDAGWFFERNNIISSDGYFWIYLYTDPSNLKFNSDDIVAIVPTNYNNSYLVIRYDGSVISMSNMDLLKLIRRRHQSH